MPSVACADFSSFNLLETFAILRDPVQETAAKMVIITTNKLRICMIVYLGTAFIEKSLLTAFLGSTTRFSCISLLVTIWPEGFSVAV